MSQYVIEYQQQGWGDELGMIVVLAENSYTAAAKAFAQARGDRKTRILKVRKAGEYVGRSLFSNKVFWYKRDDQGVTRVTPTGWHL